MHLVSRPEAHKDLINSSKSIHINNSKLVQCQTPNQCACHMTDKCACHMTQLANECVLRFYLNHLANHTRITKEILNNLATPEALNIQTSSFSLECTLVTKSTRMMKTKEFHKPMTSLSNPPKSVLRQAKGHRRKHQRRWILD